MHGVCIFSLLGLGMDLLSCEMLSRHNTAPATAGAIVVEIVVSAVRIFMREFSDRPPESVMSGYK